MYFAFAVVEELERITAVCLFVLALVWEGRQPSGFLPQRNFELQGYEKLPKAACYPGFGFQKIEFPGKIIEEEGREVLGGVGRSRDSEGGSLT